MNNVFEQTLSSQTPSHAFATALAAQSLSDTALAAIAGGMEHGEVQFGFGLRFCAAGNALPFQAALQPLPLPAGAADPHTVPWAELKPSVKELASGG